MVWKYLGGIWSLVLYYYVDVFRNKEYSDCRILCTLLYLPSHLEAYLNVSLIIHSDHSLISPYDRY
jgi:hypothetical protein